MRAITAFIRIDAAHMEAQVAEAVKFLNAAREEYKAAGFEVETIRVVTQPLADYTKGMKHGDALALLRKYGELAAKLGFSPNLGAVQLTDDDDRATVDLAIDVFASTKINGSLVVAAENGIHWKSIREAARLVKAVAAKSPNGGGNLNFATTAMVKQYRPFYPGAWHNGPGKTFAVGLESANVVAEVFAQVHEPGPAESKLAEALTGASAARRGGRGANRQGDAVDLCRHRSHTGAAGRCLYRARHRELYRRAVRLGRHHDHRRRSSRAPCNRRRSSRWATPG